MKKKKRKQVISCGCVVWRIVGEQLQILLIKQFAFKDTWGIPKGHINADETDEECAIRETHEETGINVELEKKLPNVLVKYKHGDKLMMSFLAHQLGTGEPHVDNVDSEVASVEWFNVNELPLVISYQQKLITHVIKMLCDEHMINDRQYDDCINDAMHAVFKYASNIDDWLTIKKEMLKFLNSNARMLFSKRHPLTKKQRTNNFERTLATKWGKMTGRPVIMPIIEQ